MSEALINPDDSKYHLGHDQMDKTHLEFIALVNLLHQADKAEFIQLFQKLIEHTEAHFNAEKELMEDSAFPAIREHNDEHARVIGEMYRFGRMLEKGSTQMARAYVRERLPDWFNLHAATMDSALAAHLKHCGLLLLR